MKDLEDYDEFPLFARAWARGFWRNYGVPSVVGPITRRVAVNSGYSEHTPDLLDFRSTEDYSERSRRWYKRNEKPGLLEEKPWKLCQIRAEIRRREKAEKGRK